MISVTPDRLSPDCLLCEAESQKVNPSVSKTEYVNQSLYDEQDMTKLRIEQELTERELCRRHLLPMIKRFERSFDASPMHELMCKKLEKFLEDVIAGKSPRLMIFMPPRHGKSVTASDYFPSWALGKYPWLEIISTSYSSSLPVKFSRRIRERLQAPRYAAVFPDTTLHKSSQNVEHWLTNHAGGYLAAGVGGGISGHGAHIFMIDDPVKDQEEADSDTISDRNWEWWSSTASTRVAPGGGVLVIQTRWGDKDLSGRMLQQMRDNLEDETIPREEIEQWEILDFPAIAEDDEWLHSKTLTILEGTPNEDVAHEYRLFRKKGEALHPERWSLSYLNKKKRSMVNRHWSALYQQRPTPAQGIQFKRDMFVRAPERLQYDDLHIIAAFDLAVGKERQHDWTVGVVGGIDHNENLYILDMVRGRWGTYGNCQAIINVFKKWKPVKIGIERGVLELALGDVLKTLCDEERIYPSFDRTLVPTTDKIKRAATMEGLMEHHRVLFPDEAAQPWVRRMMDEMLRFPAGSTDDIVDAMSWLGIMAAKTKPPQPRRRKKYESWKDRLTASSGDKHPMAA